MNKIQQISKVIGYKQVFLNLIKYKQITKINIYYNEKKYDS